MLQQTQVATVAGYFSRFVAAFPDVAALAAAPEHEVLRLWEGLGYYRRARQLHRAAQIIVEEHGGRFPDNVEAVRTLPGIGRYTAGAILSIAFGAREAILEANTVRLLSRLLAYAGDPQKKEGQRLLWTFAEELLPRRGAGTFNQALMELGSLICTPRGPACDKCPVRELCPTEANSLHGIIPRAKSKPRFEDVQEALLVVRRNGRVLLRRRQPGERWAGLWDFPRFAVESANGQPAELAEKLATLTGVRAIVVERLATLKHGVTRFRITLDCYVADCQTAPRSLPGNCRWAQPKDLADYALNTTGRKVARLISDSGLPNSSSTASATWSEGRASPIAVNRRQSRSPAANGLRKCGGQGTAVSGSART